MGSKEGRKKYAGRRKPEVLPNSTLERTHTGGQISMVGGEERGSVYRQGDAPVSSPRVESWIQLALKVLVLSETSSSFAPHIP